MISTPGATKSNVVGMGKFRAIAGWLRKLANRARVKWGSISEPKQGQILRITVAAMVAVGLSPTLVHYARHFGPRIWGNLQVFSYLVNFIPTALSILFAFVIDRDLEAHMKKRWRASIVLCGLLWSIALWHQQILADEESTEQIGRAITKAVTDANTHSDEQFKAVQRNVGGVDEKVGSVGTSLTQTTTSLSAAIRATNDAIEKTSDRLDARIGKVGKPEPTELAKLRFSFLDASSLTSPEPVQSETVPVSPERVASFDFLVRNVSGAQAEAVDVWVTICDACKFAEEPSGFEHAAGSNEHERHRAVGGINPGVAFGVMTIKIKIPPVAPRVLVGFTGSCKNCGPITAMSQFVLLIGPSVLL